VGEDEDHVAGPGRVAGEEVVGPFDHHVGGGREPGAGEEGLPRVADRHQVAELRGDLRHLGGEVDGGERRS
jgi:hypothetical protein